MSRILAMLLLSGSVASLPAPGQQPGPTTPVGGAEGAPAGDSLFPLWKSLLAGKEFLPPYGVNLTLVDIQGTWDVESFSVSVDGHRIVGLSGTAKVHPFTYGGRADVWVLPFLNVFAVAGGVKLNVQAVGEDLPLGVGGVPPEVIRGDVLLDLDFTGSYTGFGTVLAGAWGPVFAAADGSAVWTHLVSQSSGVEGNELVTYTASVRAGYIAKGFQPYVGARYIRKISHFEGTAAGPGGRPITFAVDLRAPEWNYEVGARAFFARHYEVVVEAGFGERTHGIVNLGYRF